MCETRTIPPVQGYTKLFQSILASTIWREPNETRIVWITMLAMADKRGVVEASVPGLADMARVSLACCKRALKALQTPDRYSRTREHDGRRIEPVDGGWLLLNHGKYRAKLNADDRREYLKVKQRESRARRLSTGVNKHQQKSTVSTQAEAEAEADKDQDQRASAHRVLVKVVHEILDARDRGDLDPLDVPESVKVAVAKAHIQYDAEAIRKALDAAEAVR